MAYPQLHAGTRVVAHCDEQRVLHAHGAKPARPNHTLSGIAHGEGEFARLGHHCFTHQLKV